MLFNTSQKIHRRNGISTALKEKSDLFFQNGQINSYYRVRSTQKALEEYTGGPISLEDITPQWLNAVENFWRCNGMCYTSIKIYMKTLKSVVTDCVRKGQIPKEKSPFNTLNKLREERCTADNRRIFPLRSMRRALCL